MLYFAEVVEKENLLLVFEENDDAAVSKALNKHGTSLVALYKDMGNAPFQIIFCHWPQY